MCSKIQPFDVKIFVEKVKLYASLKDYDDEKHAQLLASYLNAPAFDVYMRLSADEKEVPSKIEEELLKDFERTSINRGIN